MFYKLKLFLQRHLSISALEKTLAKAEEALNLIGYIPLISLHSAAVRLIGGLIQLILGFGLALLYFCILRFSSARKMKHFFHLKKSFAHGCHGISNIVRSNIEAVPFLGLILCLPYDRLLKKRFKYEVETRCATDTDAEEIHIG